MAMGKVPDEAEGGDGAIFADINITPLTDIFLVLLIIFMVTSTVMIDNAASHGMKVNLPKGENKEIDTAAKSLRIVILKSGEIQVDGQAIKPEDLKNLFQSTVAKDASTQVIIEADEGTQYGSAVHVMELAKQSGLSRLAIATKN